MKVWLARDETLGYSLRIHEPSLFKLNSSNKTMFINPEYPADSISVYPEEMVEFGFPVINLNTVELIDIDDCEKDYFFMF